VLAVSKAGAKPKQVIQRVPAAINAQHGSATKAQKYRFDIDSNLLVRWNEPH